MGIFDNFKKKLLNKKVNKEKGNRNIEIMTISKYHNILIIFNKTEEEKEIKNHLELIFQNAKITSLSFRSEKTDESSGFFYSFNQVDIGLGKIKNERLIGLINTNFDLVIDFVSESTELDYFVDKTNSSLKIGDLHSTKNYLYDILIERGKTNSNFIDNIRTQINLLSQ